MIGAIIGDIVGSRFEFRNIKTKDFDFFHSRCSATDDSIMSLAVAKSILECNGDYTNLNEITIQNMQTFGLKYSNASYGGMFRHWLIQKDPKPYNSFGNGAAMRVSACGYLGNSLEEVKLLAKKVTEITHNHPEGLKAAEVTSVCIFMARNNKTKEEIYEYALANYEINYKLDMIRDFYDFDVTCQGTMPVALIAFFESTDFEDAIRNAISVGGDSDTIACITGGIAEAYYGVPDWMKEKAKKYLNAELLEILNDVQLKV